MRSPLIRRADAAPDDDLATEVDERLAVPVMLDRRTREPVEVLGVGGASSKSRRPTVRPASAPQRSARRRSELHNAASAALLKRDVHRRVGTTYLPLR